MTVFHKGLCCLKKKRNKLLCNFIQFYIIFKMLPCFPFLCWVKFCSGCFRQVFFHLENKKKWLFVALGKWSSYTVTIVWKFAWADSALVVLDDWSFFRGYRLNRFDCTKNGKRWISLFLIKYKETFHDCILIRSTSFYIK